ncbi:flagellar hook-length control protein FliK [Caldimonas thermodepolymerans]|uniref:Uncharacterized protein n=1 Tax=Caldimonas thermodepolymerans TaxID=215580 RepID=A0A2S5T0I0_9BURK|nr:flagellar hook-length control protein FliK [Caldimonas thermodepolymerans]PPE68473.1 hypothetical protein C1702_16965 [Caldimonas thermodepolymerans]QPC30790.1 flagellar hook-length control protein FliK [Caldimonas thermodepolymerans]RDI02589.1 flagellar hook-length control protein FliK [Caldimonas thermodepolymerans]
MSAITSLLLSAPVAPVPPPAPVTPTAASRGFSQLLRQAQQPPAPEAQPPRAEEAPGRGEAQQRPAEAEPARESADADEADATLHPDAAALMVALEAAPPPREEAAVAAAATAAADDVTDEAAAATPGARAARPGQDAGTPDLAATQAGHAPVEEAEAGAADTEAAFETLMAATAEATQRASGAPARTAEPPPALAAVPGTAPVGATSATGAAQALASRHVDTPADAPEFPQALASQVSYLVRDGVQQARLTLNPAEMGPISVQIAVQGQQAQVDFAAASAATRAAIEQSLSHLAAALHEAGLTLSGGGVSQQHQPARQAGPASTPGGRSGRGDVPDAEPVAPVTAPARRIDGRLDLYA